MGALDVRKGSSWGSAVFLFLLFSGMISGCTKNLEHSSGVIVPMTFGPTVDAGPISSGTGKKVTLSNGAEIFLQIHEGKPFFLVEGTFAKDSFSALLSKNARKPEVERKAIVAREIEKIFAQVRSIHGLGLTVVPEVGYFTFELPYPQSQSGSTGASETLDIMAPLNKLRAEYAIIMNPVALNLASMDEKDLANSFLRGIEKNSGSGGRQDTSGFSGLDRVRAPEFVKRAEVDIGSGAKVDGSSVRVGVADTGISMRQSMFKSSDGSRIRIDHMRDFTAEGRVYFNPSAAFKITPLSADGEELLVDAQVIMSPTLPSLPAADAFTDVKGLLIKVSPALRAILLKPGSGAKLGVLDESLFQSADNRVDLNGDGSLDSKLYLILVPGETPEKDVVYVDTSGTGDFRTSVPVGDWNRTRTSVPSFAEMLGFSLGEGLLPNSSGTDSIAVRTASLVGFDPGNHGSHVSGIIAGRQTFANDVPSTLARGVAPETTLVVDRACSNLGGCKITEALVDLVVHGHAQVVNLSVGGSTPFNDGYGVLDTLINRMTSEYNVLFVVAAGNSGPARQTVEIPSTARFALSVGATATQKMIQRQYQWPGPNPDNSSEGDKDFVFFFSSRGPTAAGGFKPDVMAPGTELSAIQLNAAPGERGGLDVYWGTSMATPTAVGSFALLLDAIKKYNLKNPGNPLTEDAVTLREVLRQSARPFDVSRFDSSTGEALEGQYTWVDQGMGMIDLVAAWKKVFELRDHRIPGSVQWEGKPIALDYEVMVPTTNPNGVSYNGTRAGRPGVPAFGKGVYFNSSDTDALRQVYVSRKLPEKLASHEEAGDLMAQLRTTRDEFVLKTWIYGSSRPWVKVGTQDRPDCGESDEANLSIVGDGALVRVGAGGTGRINSSDTSTLNICTNSKIIQEELEPGDHGALVLAFRTVNGAVEALPSFVVPVYLTIPQRSPTKATGYRISGVVPSFGVKRNYIKIPKGVSLVKVTLEVPDLRRDENGEMAPGETYSGVELMKQIGFSVASPLKREDLKVYNCDVKGRDSKENIKQSLTFSVNDPEPEIWDLPVMGSYRYAKSKYTLKVDYVMATPIPEKVEGGLSALSGSLKLILTGASIETAPDPIKSSFEIHGLQTETHSRVESKGKTFVADPEPLRHYSAEVKKVSVSLKGSPESDLAFAILECNAPATRPTDPTCAPIAVGKSSSDQEAASFVPKGDHTYAVEVDGPQKEDSSAFVLTETRFGPRETGSLSIHGSGREFIVEYTMSDSQRNSSRLLNEPFFLSAKSSIVGEIILRTADNTAVLSVPVKISEPKSVSAALVPFRSN